MVVVDVGRDGRKPATWWACVGVVAVDALSLCEITTVHCSENEEEG
jgi:hypothetical protein